MGTAKLLVFIPLPPFLCQTGFGEGRQIQVGYEAGDSPPPPLTCHNPGRKAGQNRGRRAQEAEGGTLAGSNLFHAKRGRSLAGPVGSSRMEPGAWFHDVACGGWGGPLAEGG